MSNKAKLFKSSMNGFNKDDVNKYIIDINNEFAAKEEDYKSEAKRLMARLEEAEKKSAEAEAKLKEAEVNLEIVAELESSLKNSEESLTEYKSRCEELEAQYSLIENDLTLSKERIKVLEEACNTAIARCSELEAEFKAIDEEAACEDSLDSSENECEEETDNITSVGDDNISIAEKARLYDKLTAQVGEIIINANKSADEIIRNAELSAEKLSSGSAKLAEESHEKLKGLTDATVSSVKKDLYTGVEACIREFKSYAEDVSGVSKNMIADLERKYSTLSSRIEYLGSTIEKRMSAKIRDFNGKCNAISNDIKKGSEN